MAYPWSSPKSRLNDAMEVDVSPRTVANPLSGKVFHTVTDIRITGVEDVPKDEVPLSQKLVLDSEASSTENAEQKERATNMQIWWDDAMKRNFDLPAGYLRVAVLLIKWAEELDELDTRAEAEELEAVFRDQFHYHTQIVELNLSSRPQHQISRYLSAFVETHDGPDNLMIVYYTGHGEYRDHEGFLQLMGSTSSASKRGFNADARANWNKAEEILSSTDIEGDVLTILDTCYSSNLVKSGKEDTRVFELLSACAMDATTAAPGKHSFTRALIDAMKELLAETGDIGFNTQRLNQRILLNPRRRDTPSQLWHRLKQDERNVRLAPLKDDKNRGRRHSYLLHPTKGYLTLRFALRYDFLDQETIEYLAKNLSKAFHNKSLIGLKKIDWLGLKPARVTNFGRAGLAIFAIAQWKRFVHRKKEERNAKKSVDDVHIPMDSGDSTMEPTQRGSMNLSPTRKRTRENHDEYMTDAKRSLLDIPQPPSPPVSDQAEEAG